MAGKDITKASKSPDVQILKQGHTTSGDFGSNPQAKILGGRQVRDITIPTAK